MGTDGILLGEMEGRSLKLKPLRSIQTYFSQESFLNIFEGAEFLKLPMGIENVPLVSRLSRYRERESFGNHLDFTPYIEVINSTSAKIINFLCMSLGKAKLKSPLRLKGMLIFLLRYLV